MINSGVNPEWRLESDFLHPVGLASKTIFCRKASEPMTESPKASLAFVAGQCNYRNCYEAKLQVFQPEASVQHKG